MNSQTGVYDNGDTWTSSIANGHVQSWTTFDGGSNESWSKIEYNNLDSSTGNWGIISTTYDDGARSDAYTDLNHIQWYESAINWFDAKGNFYQQTGVADNGDAWVATIDHGEVQSWTTRDGGANDPWSVIAYSNRDPVSNQWMTVSTTYDDGGRTDAYTDLNHTGEPFDDMGWCASFHRGRSGGYSIVRVKCGAWDWIGNDLFIEFPDQLSVGLQSIRSLILEIQSIYNPDAISSNSWAAVHRRSDLGQPRPVVDWMVYLANTIIPAEELPMVHSVERVGSGTLVILKKEPVHLENLEDLALVEAVEPIIRRHQPDIERKPRPRRPQKSQ